MLTFDATVTVYYSVYNEATGYSDYFRAVIRGVSWYSKIKAVAGATGIQYDRLFRVRIPDGAQCDKLYTAPNELGDPETQYTLKAGSRVLKGEGPPAPKGGDEWARLLSGREEAFQVLDSRDNRRFGLKHLYVEGK